MSEREEPFVRWLYAQADEKNRGVMAELRRGLVSSGGAPMGLYRYITRFCRPNKPWREKALLIVGPLFAMHGERGSMKLPAVLYRVGQERGSESIDARMVALLECHEDDLAIRLRHVVSLVRGKPLDWHDLFYVVSHWSHPDKWAQRDWARLYWAPTRDKERDEDMNQEPDGGSK